MGSTIYFKKLECPFVILSLCHSVILSFCHSVRQQNYWSEYGGWDGQKVGKRGGQMDRQPGGQEVGYRMVGWVGSMLCPPESFKYRWSIKDQV